MPFSHMQPRTSSGTSWGSSSGASSWATSTSSDEEMESQSSETLSSGDEDYGVSKGQAKDRGEEKADTYQDDEELGTIVAVRRRRRQRRQREQLRPGCCQTALLLIQVILVQAANCTLEVFRRCCSSPRRGASGRRSRTRDKPVLQYTKPGWDSDSSSDDGLSSASERQRQDSQLDRQLSHQRIPGHQTRSQRPRLPQRQSVQEHNDDGESTLSDTSSDANFASPRDPVESPSSGGSTMQADRHRGFGSGHTTQTKRAALRLRPASPVQSSSGTDSDIEDAAASMQPQRSRRRQRQPQIYDGDSSDSDSSGEDDFVSPHDSNPASPSASSRRPTAQPGRQRTAGGGVGARRKPSPSTFNQQAFPPTANHSSKQKSTALKLRPAQSSRGSDRDTDSDSDVQDVLSSVGPTFEHQSSRGSAGSAAVAIQRVRQHSDLRVSMESDTSQPHVEEWLAHPELSNRLHKGVSSQRGVGGEELIHQLAATLRQHQATERDGSFGFIDPDFPPQNASLYRENTRDKRTRDGAALGPVFLASVSREEVGSSDTAKKPVVWCRAAEIGLKAELQIKRTDTSARGDDIVGPDSIRQLVKDGTLNDDAFVFFPYKTEQGRRHPGWHGTHRRWAECGREFAGGELAAEHTKKLKVWHNGDVKPSDIKQGLLGDCYLMAACASIALLPPEYLVHDLIIDCSDVGLFGVKFWVAGRWISVAIDDRFPCIISGGILRPCFAQPSSDGALWTCIIEKAFAKLMGSFEALIGGQAVDAQNYLCAGDIETLELNGPVFLTDLSATENSSDTGGKLQQKEKQQRMKENAVEQIWRELCGRVPLPRDRSVASIVIDGRQPTTGAAFFSCAVSSSQISAAATLGLHAQHQYSILGAIELASSGERIIELQDPHGNCGWNGAFSVTDTARWTSTVKREILGSSRLSVPESGCAFMRWNDFKMLFDEIGICSAFPQAQDQGLVRRESVIGRWEAGVSAGGKCGLETFKFNPAFQLRFRTKRSGLSRRVRVKVTLSQPDTRSMAQQSDVAGSSVCDNGSWEDMYLYCLTQSTYRRLTAPRTVVSETDSSGADSSKLSLRQGASRLSGRLLSRQQPQPVESSDPYVPTWVREISPAVRLRRRLGQAELELDPQENYVLVACAWGPGVSNCNDTHTSRNESKSSIAGVGQGWDFCITMHTSADVRLSLLDSDSSLQLPTREQKLLMQLARSRQACCSICKRGFEPGGTFYEIPEGQAHLGKCYETYRETTAVRCLECGGAILGRYHQLDEEDPEVPALRSKLSAARGVQESSDDWKQPLVLHAENGCYDRYRERTAPRCAVCSGPVLSKYYEVEAPADGHARTSDTKLLIIHEEGDCYQQYQEATAERCLVCKRPVLSAYYDVKKDGEEGKVHADGPCYQQWQQSVAPRCTVCHMPIIGNSYEVGVHGAREQVHADGNCLDRWKAKQKDRAGAHDYNHDGAASDDY